MSACPHCDYEIKLGDRHGEITCSLVMLDGDAKVLRHAKTDRLEAAARALYLAGKWELVAMPQEEQARLWTALRDALALPPGTATQLGIGASNNNSNDDN